MVWLAGCCFEIEAHAYMEYRVHITMRILGY